MLYQHYKEVFSMEYGHKTKSRKKPSGTSGGFITALIIIVTIALIAGVLVFSPIGGNLLQAVKPFFSCSGEKQNDDEIVSALKVQDEKIGQETPEPNPTDKAHETITIDETVFYILQMGTYLSEKDAKEHADQIQRLGAGGVVYTDGSVFRVFAAAYLDESSLMKVQSQVRADGFEATPYITDNKALRITLDGNHDAIQVIKDACSVINGIPVRLCEISLAYDKSEMKSDDVDRELQKLTTQCSDSIKALASVNNESIDPIRELLAKYKENISTFLREHDTMNMQIVSGELKHLQLSVIMDYILFYDRK